MRLLRALHRVDYQAEALRALCCICVFYLGCAWLRRYSRTLLITLWAGHRQLLRQRAHQICLKVCEPLLQDHCNIQRKSLHLGMACQYQYVGYRFLG